ncbi:MAG TPA: AgmX/PglI C-terminal domain-containing protein [Anaeromyxobacteraceae bacterium]|jgi:predicted Zn finger-like uncharacterized protein|nr:AgmX/PglI C-terminal domain-containing protein [Anaeromyxobacteraceae bacterium]
MQFSCEACEAKYLIPEERLGRAGVRVRCKRCGHVVRVRPGAPAELELLEDAAVARNVALVPPPPPAAGSGPEWFLAGEGQASGPVPDAEVRRRLAAGELSRGALVWREGLVGWTAASAIPELGAPRSPLAPAPPPLPAPAPVQSAAASALAELARTPAREAPRVAAHGGAQPPSPPARAQAPVERRMLYGAAALAVVGAAALGAGIVYFTARPAPSPALPRSAGEGERVASSSGVPRSGGEGERVASSPGGWRSGGEGERVAPPPGVPRSGGEGERVASSTGVPRSGGAGEDGAAASPAAAGPGRGATSLARPGSAGVERASEARPASRQAAPKRSQQGTGKERLAAEPRLPRRSEPRATSAAAAPAAAPVASAPVEKAPRKLPPPSRPARSEDELLAELGVAPKPAGAAAPVSAAPAPPRPATVAKARAPDPLDAVSDEELARELAPASPAAPAKRSVYVPPAPGSELPERLSPEQVNQTVVTRMAELKQCIADQRAAEPGLKGTLKLRFVIGGDGAVRDLRPLTDELAQKPISRCIAGVVKEIRFPRSRAAGQEVVFPFKF